MEELIKYFCNLLIIQYRNKPKAKATIEALVRETFEDIDKNVFLLEYQNAFNLDTAVGPQIKTLAKYIGCNDSLSVPQTNYFKLSDTEGQDETPGLSDVYETYTGYPLLSYSGYTYVIKSIIGTAGIDLFRIALGFLSEMKNEVLSLGNLDFLLDKYFENGLYVEEGDKSITYIYTDKLSEKFEDDTALIETFIKNTMPRPMGCSISVQSAPYRLNLVSFGGAEVDEDFIYSRDENWYDTNKYFETPYDIDISSQDSFEMGMKIKVLRDYSSAGFARTSDPMDRFSFYNSGADRKLSVYAFAHHLSFYTSTDLVNKWLNIIFQKITPGGALFATIIADGELVASDIQVPATFYYTGKMQFGIGYSPSGSVGFNGQIDFKECYIKKNNEVVWKGITNIKGGI